MQTLLRPTAVSFPGGDGHSFSPPTVITRPRNLGFPAALSPITLRTTTGSSKLSPPPYVSHDGGGRSICSVASALVSSEDELADCNSDQREPTGHFLNPSCLTNRQVDVFLECRLKGMMRKRKSSFQVRGQKHLTRLNAPKHWMLGKLGGSFAPKPSGGPHKSSLCLPLIIILRDRLRHAPSHHGYNNRTYRGVIASLKQRQVLVDGKVRTDKTYPAGFMDVVSIAKTNENFRLLYDSKGRFQLQSIEEEEAKFKLCKVRSVQLWSKGIPYISTYDSRTVCYPDPLIQPNDTIKLDLKTNKIMDFIKFDVGNLVMVTDGRNKGRVGVIKSWENDKGSLETVHVLDASGHEFGTLLSYVFTIGKGTNPWVTLPKSMDLVNQH